MLTNDVENDYYSSYEFDITMQSKYLNEVYNYYTKFIFLFV